MLPYSCYELGHTWQHSCSAASFEIGIIGFLESLQIYGVVYLVCGFSFLIALSIYLSCDKVEKIDMTTLCIFCDI